MRIQGETKLHKAAAKGNIVEVKKLISKGADLHAVNCLGQSALCYAVANRHIQCVKTLAKKQNCTPQGGTKMLMLVLQQLLGEIKRLWI